jgi:hypothetical protein
MKNWMLAAALWAAASPGWGSPLTGLAHSIQEAGLDSGACFRVRDLHIVKEDIRIYLTDGYLIFGKPVNGVRLSAVFSADVEGGDAEILLFPPRRSERMSLASYTQTPNLNEHFNTAVMLFSDDTGEHLLREITGSETVRRSPERGAVLQAKWESVIRNLTTSFEIRLVGDMSSPRRQQHGFFFAALQGRRLGNFDLVYDPYAAERLDPVRSQILPRRQEGSGRLPHEA